MCLLGNHTYIIFREETYKVNPSIPVGCSRIYKRCQQCGKVVWFDRRLSYLESRGKKINARR